MRCEQRILPECFTASTVRHIKDLMVGTPRAQLNASSLARAGQEGAGLVFYLARFQAPGVDLLQLVEILLQLKKAMPMSVIGSTHHRALARSWPER